MRLTDDLSERLRTLPTGPGIYLFKDADGRVLYIGKAKNLRSRVRSYFQSSRNLEPKTLRMIGRAVDFDLIGTANEVESLILEANLVKEHKPRYNIRLKDDKQFPYVKVTTSEPFPRVLVVRKLEKDGNTYFGPYTSVTKMRKTLQMLTRVFQIRTCNLVIPAPEGKTHKVCLDYHIKRCAGPCEDLQSQDDYAEGVTGVLMALTGKVDELIEQLTVKMQAAAADMRFEDARRYKVQIDGLRSISQKQSTEVQEKIDRDVISLAREGKLAVCVVLQIRNGTLIGRQDFQLESDVDDSDEAIVETFLTQYYNHQPNLPRELFIPRDLESLEVLQLWLREMKGGAIDVIRPQRGEKVKVVDLAATNARMLLDELLIQKRVATERTSKMVTSLQADLGLTMAPRRIACFDISNTGETDAVGACVVFENGKPKKSEYRKFKIKGVAGQDDFKMMREVIGRYFYRIRTEERDPPDLVVVDGGKGQLSSALSELTSLGFPDQPVIGLAKRLEEIFVPGQSDAQSISKSSPGLTLLKQLRDEAHRFAITYNRKVRSKRTITSELDAIPGIGPAKRTALLKAFGSVSKIKVASVEEIAAVPGITAKLAETIKATL